jgi:hypothetical protein
MMYASGKARISSQDALHHALANVGNGFFV